MEGLLQRTYEATRRRMDPRCHIFMYTAGMQKQKKKTDTFYSTYSTQSWMIYNHHDGSRYDYQIMS